MSRVIYYNDETYDKVNQDSKILLQDYILELKAKGRAVKTIEQYEADIKSFLCYAYDNTGNKFMLDMKKRDFRNFFLKMQNDGKSSARINRMQSSLRNILEFAVDDDDEYPDYEKNQMKTIKSIEKQHVRDIVFLTDEQVTYLIDYYLEKEEYQKALYVSLSYDSAGRRNEILQVEKFSFMDSELSETNEVVGKRSKRFTLMYFKRTYDIAQLYLKQRGDDDINSLWITEHGGIRRELSYDSMYSWVVGFRDILNEKYNEDIKLNPHSFRHTSLENYENGSHYNLGIMGIERLSIDDLQKLANHESVDITQKYLKDKGKENLKDIFSMKKEG